MTLTQFTRDGTLFRVWAPRRKSVSVQTGDGTHSLVPDGYGFFTATLPQVAAGDFYSILLDGHLIRPDPCSRFQPQGVHGPSQLIDSTAYPWTDVNWRGVPRAELVVYEIHVGTFTPEGTYASALHRLDHVLDLGATAVELLPLAQTPGRWNWGYDGVDLYAPNHHYGSPDDLRRFVDGCHQRGLAVILDVVYNHLGPEGNYWADFGPYFSPRHRTPWGPALNFDSDDNRPVRDWVIQNALHWLAEYHLDGLRLDAIHLMQDDSRPHIVTELSAAVHQFAASRSFPVHLIAESNVHDPLLLDPPPTGSGYDLLWNDEIPNALFATVLGQRRVHTRTYRGAPDLRRALDAGYVFEWHPNGREIFRNDAGPRAHLSAMLQGLQTHDHIGNHPSGLRLHQVASPELQRAAAALVLLHPAVPFCFMGEEFAAPSPFCFFVDFTDPQLRQAVVEGRKRDYSHHDWAQFLSPVEDAAFLRSKLAPVASGDPGMLSWYRALLRVRRQWQSDGTLRPDHFRATHDPSTDLFLLAYAPAGWMVAANLGSQAVSLPAPVEIRLHSHWAEFGGGHSPGQITNLPAHSAAVYRNPS